MQGHALLADFERTKPLNGPIQEHAMASQDKQSPVPSVALASQVDRLSRPLSAAAIGWQGLSQLCSLQAEIPANAKWMIASANRNQS